MRFLWKPRIARCLKLITLITLLLTSNSAWSASDQMTASGIVSDATGEPLIGCTVQVKNGNVGTQTDVDGKFSLKVPQGALLNFSYVGYKPVVIKAAANMKVVMEEDAVTLNEVVAIGYGSMKRSDLTGSVVSVKGDEMQQTSAATIDQMLQGRTAGMQITLNSGAAGAGSSVQIRGVNSLSSTNEPIYVIDGSIVQTGAGSDTFSNPLSDLNPSDIESIEVLKDASATAIYGAQAANGVIIVTMKKGKQGDAPKITFKASVGWDNVPKKLEVMDLPQLAQWVKDVNGTGTNDYFAHPETLGKGTDWQDALFRTAMRQEYNLAIRGGVKNVGYSVSGSYLKQDGIVINNDFSRFTFRTSVDVKAYKWLDFSAIVNIAQTDRNTGMAQWGVVGNALSMTPNIPVKNPDGSWGKGGYNSETNSFQANPVAMASITTRKNKIPSVRANFNFTIKPWSWLNWRNEGVYDINTDNYRYFVPAYDLGGTYRDYAEHIQQKTFNQYLSAKSIFTGKWKIKRFHNLEAMAGVELTHRYRDYLYGKRLGGSDSNLALGSGDASRDDNDGYTSTTRFLSFISRISYNYRGRYLLTATLRRDGSSRFARGQRWGTFPSAAFAWRISEEGFFAPYTENVNNLKLRVGYGIVGNANLADNSYQPTFENRPSPLGTSLGTYTMPNYDGLTWEKTHSWNVGLDLNLWDNRVEFIFDAFIKDTKDLLLQTALPMYSGSIVQGGTQRQWANVGSMRNKGIEFTVNAHPLKGRFTWDTNLTFSMVDNKITALNSESGFIDKTLNFASWGGETVTRTAVGHPVSQFYGYQIAGRINHASDFLRDNGDGTSTVIVATPNYRVGTIVSNADATQLKTSIGDFLFKDNNGDGIIDAKDMDFLGGALPKFTFGWNNTLRYKQFSLSLFLYGSVGGKVFNWNRRRMDEPSYLQGSATNKFTRVCNYAKWQYADGNSGNTNVWNVSVVPGADPTETRIDNNHGNYNSRVSDRYVENASFLRLKNIVFTYSFPRSVLRALHLQNLKATANIQNVCTITGYSGFNPEIGASNGQYSMNGMGMLMYGVDTGNVPIPRTYVFSLEATF